MPKYFLVIFSIVISISAAFGQKQPERFYKKLGESKADTNKVNVLLDLGKYYSTGSASSIKSDSSLYFFKKALQLSIELKNVDKQMQLLSIISGFYIKKGDLPHGREYATQVINHYHEVKNIRMEAKYVRQFADDFPGKTTAEIEENIKLYERAANLFGLCHDKSSQFLSLEYIARLNMSENKLDLAQQQLLDIVKKKYDNLTEVYSLLAEISIKKGDMNKVLEYRLKVVDNLKARKDTSNYELYCHDIALAYNAMGIWDKSIQWSEKGLEAAKRNKAGDWVYTYMHNIVSTMLSRQNPLTALGVIEKTVKDYKPVSLSQKTTYYLDMGLCYRTLKQFSKAEPNYIKADSLFELQPKVTGVENDFNNANNFMAHYLSMANFYLDFSAYQKALLFVNKGAAIPRSLIAATLMRVFERDQFKIDSAYGNFIPALHHYQRYKTIDDSLFNESKSRQFAEMDVKYETSKKEQAIMNLKQREQRALLQHDFDLTELQKANLQRDVQAGQLKQASLQQNIQKVKLQKVNLQRQSEMQRNAFQREIEHAELQKANTQRNVTFGGIALLLVISGLAYNGYRNKKRSNFILEAQQKEINQKNISLEQLLTEKDWLLKEVHHRVKNNLQIVMSLLSSQSAFLENQAAIDAIGNSQNRLHAISLLHQKLYSGDNFTTIDMPTYIGDLIGYLSDSFDIQRRQIYFDLLVDDIDLDMSQAVPLGLILNESITNAIKYAFGAEGGRIAVILQSVQNNGLILRVSDNGKGLPDQFNLRSVSSLGMQMMKALSKQLGGVFNMESNNGVNIWIAFEMENIEKVL